MGKEKLHRQADELPVSLIGEAERFLEYLSNKAASQRGKAATQPAAGSKSRSRSLDGASANGQLEGPATDSMQLMGPPQDADVLMGPPTAAPNQKPRRKAEEEPQPPLPSEKEPQPKTEAPPQAEEKPKPQPEPQAEEKPKPQPEPQAEEKPKPQPEPRAEEKPKPQPEPRAEEKPKPPEPSAAEKAKEGSPPEYLSALPKQSLGELVQAVSTQSPQVEPPPAETEIGEERTLEPEPEPQPQVAQPQPEPEEPAADLPSPQALLQSLWESPLPATPPPEVSSAPPQRRLQPAAEQPLQPKQRNGHPQPQMEPAPATPQLLDRLRDSEATDLGDGTGHYGSLFALRPPISQPPPPPIASTVGSWKVDVSAARLLPKHIAVRSRSIPLQKKKKRLTVAMADPTDMTAIDDISTLTGLQVNVVPAPASDIERAIAQAYPAGPSAVHKLDECIDHQTLFAMKSMSVAARLSGNLASVRVRQVFSNPLRDAAAAVYVLPLAGDEMISGFRMQVGDRLIEGEVQKHTHRHAALETHHTVEFQRPPDAFAVHLGQLPAGEDIVIELSFARKLAVHNGETAFHYPLRAALANTGATKNLTLTVEVDSAGLSPSRLACSLPATWASLSDQSFAVTLQRPTAPPEHDFVLRYTLAEAHPTAILLADDTHFLLSLLPPANGEAPRALARDVVFLLDQSASMAGAKMEAMKRGVIAFLNSLGESDRFAVMAFADGVQRFREGQLNSLQQLTAVRPWIRSLVAEGGTDAAQLLTEVLATPRQEGRQLSVFLIIDGQVGQETRIYDAVQKMRSDARLFTIGIGSNINPPFLRQIASLARGWCELVEDAAQLEDALRRLSRELAHPFITDLEMGETVSVPAALPDLCARRPLFVCGQMPGSGTIQLRGKLPTAPWNPSPYNAFSDNPAIGLFWARDRIGVLEDRLQLAAAGEESAVEQEIVSLALRYGLLTRRTSFVLVDRSGSESQPIEQVDIESTTVNEETIPAAVEAVAELEAMVMYAKPAEDEIPLAQLTEMVEAAPIVRMVDLIISEALKAHASHIHIEPETHAIRVRYRVDGTLHDVMSPPKDIQVPMIARLKSRAGLNVGARRIPQKGKIQLQQGGRELDLALSVIPTVLGEKVVMRVLDKSALPRVDTIGMTTQIRSDMETLLHYPHGLVLLASPAAHGTTTSLYAWLNWLNSQSVNIMTVDEQLEYQLPGATQVQTDREVGLRTSDVLRSISDQDADIIGINDIADADTARAAVEAAYRGQLVLGTLRANDAASAISTLLEMGVDRYMCASSLVAVLSQRLVRTNCSRCKQAAVPAAELVDRFSLPQKTQFYRGGGCESCRMTGFSGRIGVFELLTVSDFLRDLILQRASAAEMRRAARQHGFTPMLENGLYQALDGNTTLEELLRAVPSDLP